MPPDDRERLEAANAHGFETREPFDLEYRYYRGGYRDQVIWIRVSCDFVKDADGKIIQMVGIAQDITERKQAEDKIKASLMEKEVLLQEIHHRVKNNLQIISSMLALQARVGASKETAEALLDSERRIRVMAQVHENLYRSDDLSHISADNYLKSIIHGVRESQLDGADRHIFKDDIDQIILDIDMAIPLGQIISEVLSNSLKHAFPNGKSGTINLSLKKVDGENIELVVSDDGIGLPKDFAMANSKTLGLQLIEALTTMIKGKLTVGGPPGACFQISFKGEQS
jgi:two-component sensor histidine kinase